MSKILELADAYAGINTHTRSLTGMMEARAALVAEISRIEDALAKLEKDAARYRWLAWRSDTNPIMPYDQKNDMFFFGFECDAAIDAAMKEATNGQGN